MSSESGQRLPMEELKRRNAPQSMIPQNCPSKEEWQELLHRLDELERHTAAHTALLREASSRREPCPAQAQMEALTQDVAEIARALTVDLVIGYTVMDNSGATPEEYMSQDLVRIALADNVAYAGVELFDSQLFFSLHDLDLNTTIRSIMEKVFVIPELDDDTEVGGNAGNSSDNAENGGTAPSNAPVSGTNPIIDMYLEQITSVGEFMEPIIYLNSQGFALMVTNELLIAFISALREIINDALGSTEEDVLTDENIKGIVEEILDYMSLGIYFDE